MFPFYFFKRWPHLGCFLEIQLKLWWPYQLSTNLWWLWHPSLVSLASVLSFPWRVLFWTKSGPFYALYAALKKEAIPPKKKLEPVLKGVVGRRSRISWVNKEVKLLHQKQFLKVKKKKKDSSACNFICKTVRCNFICKTARGLSFSPLSWKIPLLLCRLTGFFRL